MSEEITRTSRGIRQAADNVGDPMPETPTLPRYVAAAVLVVIALVSFFVLGAKYSTPEAYQGTIAALDAKKETVMGLVAGSTGSSAAISVLPGDLGTPIAEKLVDLSSDFLIVIAAIYLAKYLLTILGLVAFRFLVPAGCVMGALTLVLWNRVHGIDGLGRIGLKLVLLGLAAALVVPASVWVSTKIEQTYEASIQQTLATAEQTSEEIQKHATEEESSSWIDSLSNAVTSVTQLPEEALKLAEQAKTSLNNFIEALAVMIVTSCVIPILVLLFFLWLVNLILGVNISLPMRGLPMGRPRLR